MAQALFVCYLCQESVVVPPTHFCQRECHYQSGTHRDFCEKCKNAMIVFWLIGHKQKRLTEGGS